MTTLKREISVTNATGNLARVRDFLTDAARGFGVKHEDENRIILAVDEAVSNIIEHAYTETREATVEIEVSYDDERFTVFIRDSGKVFEPAQVQPIPDMAQHVKEGSIDGLRVPGSKPPPPPKRRLRKRPLSKQVDEALAEPDAGAAEPTPRSPWPFSATSVPEPGVRLSIRTYGCRSRFDTYEESHVRLTVLRFY